MIVGLGVDVVTVERVARALSHHGTRFVERCFAPGELSRPDEAGEAAAVFALKEAALKALGTGWSSGVAFRHVRVVGAGGGRPSLELGGPAARLAAALGVVRCHATVSRAGPWVVAVVVLDGEAWSTGPASTGRA